MHIVTDPPSRGLAVPCFADDPAELVRLGIDAERAGFQGFFLWDHLVHSDTGEGPPIIDPWQVLALVAAGTARIALRGTTANFDIAVWGELDSAGQVAAALPAYCHAGATWFIESPKSGPGWLDAVRERLGGSAGRGQRS
jgi:Luciferase-like monooxygenase